MDKLTNMEAFVRVVDAGSFSAAARKWGRSKASVSKYVGALEAHLGVKLLQRTTRSLSLTDAGRAYHQRCVDLLAEVAALESATRSDDASPRGTLRVTAPPGFAALHLHLMTTDFVARYPSVTIDLDLTHRMVDLVAEGIDVAIRMTRPDDASLVARRLAPAPVLAVAAPSYLERRGAPATPADLLAHDCLVDTNFRGLGRWPFEDRGRRVTVDVSGPLRANNPLTVRDWAVAGLGVALIPELLIEAELTSGQLVEVLAGAVALEWSLYAVTSGRRYLPGRARAFIDHMAAAMASPQAEIAPQSR